MLSGGWMWWAMAAVATGLGAWLLWSGFLGDRSRGRLTSLAQSRFGDRLMV
jgi:hypothetical protein